MKQIRGLLALLLVMAMLVISAPVYAAGSGGTPEIAFGQVSGHGGERITVPVTISNNPGIASFRFRIAYDAEALHYVSVTNAEAMTGGTLKAVYQQEDQQLAITWFDVKNLAGDGVLFYLVFDVEEAVAGHYPLTVSYLPEDIVNATWEQVDMVVSDGWIQLGSGLSGEITSFGSADDGATVQLKQHGTVIDSLVSKDGGYQFASVAPGAYTLEASKKNHVTRTYDLTVTSEATTQDVKLHLLGDINGDGKANVADVSKIYGHTKETAPLTDYAFACGDIDGNGRLNVVDASKVYAHVKETKPLW